MEVIDFIRGIIGFLFLIFPGMIFRRFYFLGEFSKQYDSKSAYNSIIGSIIPGLIIQYITFYTYKIYRPINGDNLNNFLKSIQNFEINFELLKFDETRSLIIYLVLMIYYSFVFGISSWYIVRGFKLDLHYPIFRFNNYWNYYFKGEIMDTIDFKNGSNLTKKDQKHIYLTLADVLVKVDENENRMYSGILNQYSISKKNNRLETIYLTNVSRFKKNENNTILKKVEGSIMIIPYETVININLIFLYKKGYKKPFLHTFLIAIFILLFSFFIIFDNNYLYDSVNGFNTTYGLIKNIVIKVFSLIIFGTLINGIQLIIDFKFLKIKLLKMHLYVIIFLTTIVCVLLKFL